MLLAIIMEILLVLPMMQIGEAIIPSGLSDKERYNTGYKWGCSDARAGGHTYLNSHPTHTRIFMSGYYKGYATCFSGETPSPSITSSINRKNVFNNLSNCKAIEKYLTHSCSYYVTPEGLLSQQGKRAYGCISNGVLLTAGTYAVNAATPPLFIIGSLELLSIPTGCGGIVNWALLKSDVSGATVFLRLLGLIG